MKTLYNNYNATSLSFLVAVLLNSCGSAAPLLSKPIENIDQATVKLAGLSDKQKQTWSHLDLIKDSIPGTSLNLAYEKLVKKNGKSVVVAVIDSGIDILHEDLERNVWVNKGELPNNGIDDDKNGYVDDVNGWNFLGESNNERLEYVRILAKKDLSHPQFKEAQMLYEKEQKKYNNLKKNTLNIRAAIEDSKNAIAVHLDKESFSQQDVEEIQTDDEKLSRQLFMIKRVFSFGYKSVDALIKEFDRDLRRFQETLDYNLNLDFDGRSVVGDNPDDLQDRSYGNNNVMPKKGRSHGTHVSGIIAAVRKNGVGIDGAANNVKIMAIRNTPNGDEYDKDVALGVYYAVDNGAKVINMSFGKSFSPHSEWVRDAIAYAAKKDVLIVAAAGNDSKNTDNNSYYPNDQMGTGEEVSDSFLKVGSTTYKYGAGIVSGFSNYGNSSVDLFAPGSQIYSCYPDDKYEFNSGTSMAAPLVTGIAALIFSQYPKLSAAQVKQILMASGLPIVKKVSLSDETVIPFAELSLSGRLVNAYNALIMASKISK